jgi:hypothetical protein
LTLLYAMLVSASAVTAQTGKQPPAAQGQSAGAKLEAILNAAQMPFNKMEDGSYVAVISVDQNESERFHISLDPLGNDPNDTRFQIVQMYFLLGQIAKGSSFPPPLIKQINQWNSELTMGKVFAVGNVIVYATSSWLVKTDAESLAVDATLGHYSSQNLRKEIAPYLK